MVARMESAPTSVDLLPKTGNVIADERWQAAVTTWLELMASMNRFDKQFKGLPPAFSW